jgi:hypothetical protein
MTKGMEKSKVAAFVSRCRTSHVGWLPFGETFHGQQRQPYRHSYV